jgi:hypothetical protein
MAATPTHLESSLWDVRQYQSLGSQAHDSGRKALGVKPQALPITIPLATPFFEPSIEHS